MLSIDHHVFRQISAPTVANLHHILISHGVVRLSNRFSGSKAALHNVIKAVARNSTQYMAGIFWSFTILSTGGIGSIMGLVKSRLLVHARQ